MAFIRKCLRIFRHKSLESTQNSVIFAQKTNNDKDYEKKRITDWSPDDGFLIYDGADQRWRHQ